MRLTVDNGLGVGLKNGVNELVTESLSDIRGSPEDAHGDTLLEDGGSARTNTGTGGDDDHATEHWDELEDTVSWDTLDPNPGRWISDVLGGPVTSARDDERVSFLSGHGDRGKSVPFLQGSVGDAHEGTSGGSDYVTVPLDIQVR